MIQKIEDLLALVEEPHRNDCMKFIGRYGRLFDSSKGSAIKHQPWEGGYRDHITEVMNIALVTYKALETIRPLPFSLSDALFGCFLHDIEKVWKHTIDPSESQTIDKDALLRAEFHLNDDHWNAIHYAHGEGNDYHPTLRIQRPLAAFVHHCDNTSARIWFDQPKKDADEYEELVGRYYPSKITAEIASRMLVLEKRLNLETLVPDEFRSRV